MNAKVLGALAAVALLAACAEKKPEMAAASGAGAATTPTVVPGSQEDLVKNVGDRVFFDFNKSTPEQRGQARRWTSQSAWLGKYGQKNVQIAGNCDERGTEEYNIALGQRRANAARDYLVAKGTPAARMTTISFGKDRPTCTESTEACWAQNRNAITSVK